MPYFMCKNGHLVRDPYLHNRECSRCRYNEKRRKTNQQKRQQNKSK